MRVITDKDVIGQYLHDASKKPTAPENVRRVVFPRNLGDLVDVHQEADRGSFPIRYRGAGSGLTGGCVPVGDAGPEDVVVFEKLLSVPTDVDGFDFVGVTEDGKHADYGVNSTTGEFLLPAGVTVAKRDEILKSHGRMNPIQPTHSGASWLGNVATNATGLPGAFGDTRDWTGLVGVVQANGERLVDLGQGPTTLCPKQVILRTRQGREIVADLPTSFWKRSPRKNTTGLYTGQGVFPRDLFVGSSGILGGLPYAACRSLPRRVEALVENNPDIWAGMVFFEDTKRALEAAIEAVERYQLEQGRTRDNINGQGLGVVGIDIIGGGLDFARRYNQRVGGPAIPQRAQAALEIGLLYDDYGTAQRVSELMDRYGAIDSWFDPSASDAIRRVRSSVPSSVNEAVTHKVGTDSVVPLRELVAMYEHWEQRIDTYGSKRSVDGPHGSVLGHIGRDADSGGHLHFNVVSQGSDKEYRVARALQWEMIKYAMDHGGNACAEHGIFGKTVYKDGKDVSLFRAVHGDEAAVQLDAMREAFGAKMLNRGLY
jgi:FAD/FMN-containing dehydrogenase